MAKRTYHDANGYKKKRRKRGTPEFATVAEYDAWLAAKRLATRSKHPVKKQVSPSDQPLEQLVRLVKDLEARTSSPVRAGARLFAECLLC